MRLFIRGDAHGDFSFLEDFCNKYRTTKDDVLIILGDAGILYYGADSYREKRIKRYIEEFPITLFCVRGNHEDRPENRAEMKMMERFDNTVYYDPEYPHILYALDGCAYEFNGQSFLVIGGAYSVDKEYRLLMHWYWNPQEQLSGAEMQEIEERIEGRHFNHILAHTCPENWEPTYLFIKGVDQSKVDNTMEFWLEHNVVNKCTWDNYWFGHFHGDNMDICGDGKVHMLFNNIVEL